MLQLQGGYNTFAHLICVKTRNIFFFVIQYIASWLRVCSKKIDNFSQAIIGFVLDMKKIKSLMVKYLMKWWNFYYLMFEFEQIFERILNMYKDKISLIFFLKRLLMFFMLLNYYFMLRVASMCKKVFVSVFSNTITSKWIYFTIQK